MIPELLQESSQSKIIRREKFLLSATYQLCVWHTQSMHTLVGVYVILQCFRPSCEHVGAHDFEQPPRLESDTGKDLTDLQFRDKSPTPTANKKLIGPTESRRASKSSYTNDICIGARR